MKKKIACDAGSNKPFSGKGLSEKELRSQAHSLPEERALKFPPGASNRKAA
jgi:hypothetical protein